MDAAVNLIERIYQNQEMSERLAMLINISGRQRMLSQRMVLQLCLHHSAISSNDLLQELLITMNRFSSALNILQRVTLAALRGQISKQIIQRLSAAQGEWRTLRAFLSMAMMSGSKQSIGDLLDADRRAEDLLGKMNEIVLLYEKKPDEG
jgi:hypothetical protein